MKIVAEVLFGSKLYGTDTAESDDDFRGVFIPDPTDILLGRVKDTVNRSSTDATVSNQPGDVDRDYYSLNKFVQLLLEGDVGAFDMLHAPIDKTTITSPLWDELVAKRSMFYTSALPGLFNHIQNQSRKYGIRGHRMKMLDSVLAVLDGLTEEQKEGKVRAIADLLPVDGDLAFHLEDNTQRVGCWDFYQVLDRRYQWTISVKSLREQLLVVQGTYSKRTLTIREADDVNWKDLSHGLRVGYQLLDIYQWGFYAYPLDQTEHLIAVKQGKVPLETVMAELAALLPEVEEKARESFYPEKPNYEYWESFVLKHYRAAINE